MCRGTSAGLITGTGSGGGAARGAALAGMVCLRRRRCLPVSRGASPLAGPLPGRGAEASAALGVLRGLPRPDCVLTIRASRHCPGIIVCRVAESLPCLHLSSPVLTGDGSQSALVLNTRVRNCANWSVLTSATRPVDLRSVLRIDLSIRHHRALTSDSVMEFRTMF